MKKFIIGLIAACISAVAVAQPKSFDPTNRVIELIVPYPPGGATDKLARIVDEILTEHGWKVVVNNRAGANGVIGGNHAARAKPDGHTLFVSGTGLLDANIVFQQEGIQYNEKSFTPIVPLANVSYVLTVNRNLPIKNYNEFKAYVKANPNRFNVAFWNANTANAFYKWAETEGLPKPNIILYKGSGPQVVDVLAGHVDFAWDTWVAIAPYHDSDKIRIVATLDDQGAEVVKSMNRSASVISVARQHPELSLGVWYGLWAPAGTPADIVNEINRVINQSLRNKPAVREKIEGMHIKSYGGTPEDLGRRQAGNFRLLNSMKQSRP